MDTNKWKVEKDLLAEAYNSLYGEKEDKKVDEEADDGDNYQKRAHAAGEKFGKSGARMFVDPDEETDKDDVKEEEAIPVTAASELGIHADRPAGDDNLELDPLEVPEDVIDGEIPHEAQALLDELKAPSFDLEQLARERRLSDYIAFLNTLLKGAEEFNTLKQPPDVD
jgi:hypothetical protein